MFAKINRTNSIKCKRFVQMIIASIFKCLIIYVLYVIETEGINDGDKIEKEVRIDWLLMVAFVGIVYQ